MAILTAKYKGGIISVETAVKMKAAAKRANEKQQNFYCDKCDWPIFLRDEQTSKNGKVTPPYFQHYPGHPFCYHSGDSYETMRDFAHLYHVQTRRDARNSLLMALTELYQAGGQLVEDCGEFTREIKVPMPELRGWRQEKLFALEEQGYIETDSLDENSVRQLIARQGASLRAGVFDLLSSINQGERPVTLAKLAQEIQTFQPVVDRTLRLVAAVELAYPNITSPRDPDFADFLSQERRDLSSYSETLARASKFYLEHQSTERGANLRSYEQKYFEDIYKQLRECSENIGRAEEKERADIHRKIRRLEKRIEDILAMIPLMTKEGWDVGYFAEVSGYSLGTVGIKLASFEKSTGCKFDVGPHGRKFTKQSVLAAGFKEWLGKKGQREEV